MSSLLSKLSRERSELSLQDEWCRLHTPLRQPDDEKSPKKGNTTLVQGKYLSQNRKNQLD